MSVSAFDDRYASSSPTGVLRARPLGILAATMIGGVTILILGSSFFFLKPRPTETANTSAPAPAPAAAIPQAPEPVATPTPVAPPKLFATFDITAPDFAKEKKTFSLRRRELGGRDDIITVGEFSSGATFLRLTIQQAAGEKVGNSDFFLDMNRHATQAGLSVIRISPPSPLPSRFGAFEAADIRLIQNPAEASPTAPAGERSCLAVRLTNPNLSLEIAGLACGAGAKGMDKRAMTCVLNHLDYLAPGENKPLDQFFAKADAGDSSQSCLVPATPAAGAKPARAASQGSKRSTQAR